MGDDRGHARADRTRADLERALAFDQRRDADAHARNVGDRVVGSDQGSPSERPRSRYRVIGWTLQGSRDGGDGRRHGDHQERRRLQPDRDRGGADAERALVEDERAIGPERVDRDERRQERRREEPGHPPESLGQRPPPSNTGPAL